MAVAGIEYIRGENRRLFVEAEGAGAWRTYVPFAAADAMRITDFKCDAVRKRVPRDEAQSTVGERTRDTEGVLDVKFSGKCYVYPAAAAGSMSAHGFHDILANAFGVATAPGGTYDKYAFTSNQALLTTIELLHVFLEGTRTLAVGDRSWAGEKIQGAVITKLTLRCGGPVKIECEFEGFGTRHHSGHSQLITGTSGATDFVCGTTHGSRGWDVGAMLMITGGSYFDNTGAGYPVTVVNDTTNKVTVGAALAPLPVSYIQPWSPAESLVATNPLIGVTGSFKFFTEAFPILTWEITIERPHIGETEQYGQEELADIFTCAKRSVKGQCTVRSRHDILRMIGMGRAKREPPSIALEIYMGPATGRYGLIEASNLEIEYSSPAIAAAGVGQFTIPFTCKETSGDDELTLKMY